MSERSPFSGSIGLLHCLTLSYISRSNGQRNEVLYSAIINIPDNHKGNPAESVSLRSALQGTSTQGSAACTFLCATVSGPRLKNVCFGIRNLDRGSSSDKATLTTALLCSNRRACLSSAPCAIQKRSSHWIRPQRLATCMRIARRKHVPTAEDTAAPLP